MKLGFASPVSLQLLRHLVDNGDQLPSGYQFAPAADWVQELMNRRHHVYLYSTSREIDSPRTFCGDRLTIRIASLRPRGTGRDLFAAERNQLRQLMIADQCQIIHAHWTYQFALAAMASRIPTLITIHDLPWKVLAHFRDFHRAARLLMAYKVARRGLYFTAVSQDAASHFRRYLAPGANITVIPNGLPNSIFSMGESAIPQRSDAVVYASILQGWSRRKNGTTALKAFGLIRSQIPGSQFKMFGNGYEAGGPAHQWAIHHGLDVGVSFQGPLAYSELLKKVSANVDVIVHPSLDEAFSMTALEALALKKVFIAGIVTPGMKEMLDYGKSGILVDVTDPQAIANAMLQVAQNRAERDLLAQTGFDRASQRYRLGDVISQYESLYFSILRTLPAGIGALPSAI